jgi:hypothetical protein
MISCMISYFFDNSIVIYPFLALLCLWNCKRYHIHIIRNLRWYLIVNMISPMIWPSDISITWYHNHTISQILWCYSLYHGTWAARWRGLGAPCARCSSSSSGLAIANVLGTCVHLNGDGLDPTHGLVAKAAVRVVHRGRFVVVGKSWLAAASAAGCAAHAAWGKAPMDSSRWHRGFKYGLGFQYGFKWRRAKLPITAASTWKLELRVRTESDWLRGWSRMRFARRPSPPTLRDVLNPWPPMTGFKI